MTMQDAISGPQLFFQGRISDQLTQAGLKPDTAEFSYSVDGNEWIVPALFTRFRADGYFSVVAHTREVFASIRRNHIGKFRLTVTRRGHQPAEVVLDVTAAQMGETNVVSQVGGINVTTRTIVGAPFTLDLALTPNSVGLEGVVIIDHDLNQPVTGADITLTTPAGPTIQSDADGNFRFDSLPAARAVSIDAVEGLRTATLAHTVDYSNPMNRVVINLETP